MSASTAPTWRRWILPAVCVLLIALGQGLPPLWEWADFYPAWRMKLTHAGTGATVVGIILLAVWFFALAGFSARLRLVALGLLVASVVAAVAAIGGFDFNGDLRPIPRFRWEPSAEALFDESREERERPADARAIDLTVDPVLDFPRYRGWRGDGIVTPPELFSTDWQAEAPTVVWRRRCGGGYSGFAVAGNVAITLEQRHDNEALVCYDRDSGRENWVYEYEAHFRDVFGDGPRSTPTIHDGRVYSLGATGHFVCVNGVTGEKVWDADVLSAKNRPVTWGVSGSPLVVEDLGVVIVAVGGKQGPSLAAYDLADGTQRWTTGEPGGGYSSPILATLAGRRQIILFDSAGLAGFDVIDGKELWRHGWKTFQDMNIIQPIVLPGDRVFVSSEASNGSALLQIGKTEDGFAASVLWETKEMSSKFSNPVALGGAIYGLSGGTLVCLDERTGERLWKGKRYGHGQILAAGGSLIVLSERGSVALVAADSKVFKQQASLAVFKDKTWNTPALAGRRLFVRNAAEMACLELPRR
jgi:outer membrane protein assembly factor BamB